jgi:mannose-6-phosphate isomerase-like protein (cupin superfamily)
MCARVERDSGRPQGDKRNGQVHPDDPRSTNAEREVEMAKEKSVTTTAFDWDKQVPWSKKVPFQPGEQPRPCVIHRTQFVVANAGSGRPDGHAPTPCYVIASTPRLGFVCIMIVAPGDYFESSNHPNDETYYQVDGTLHLANSHTGQVMELHRSEALLIPAYEYHVGYNLGNKESVTLACVPGESHTPEMKADPVLEHHFGGPEVNFDSTVREHAGHPSKLRELAQWPPSPGRGAVTTGAKDNVLIPRSQWLRFITGGLRAPVLTSLYFCSAMLAAGSVMIPPGRISSPQQFSGETVLFTIDRPVVINIPSTAYAALHAEPGEAIFIPPGIPFEYQNFTGEPVEVFFWTTPWEGAGWFQK